MDVYLVMGMEGKKKYYTSMPTYILSSCSDYPGGTK